jgi:mono/diheme cytochrome c family protein
VRYRGILIAAVIIALAALAAVEWATTASISALPAPSRYETWLAGKARDSFVRRAARGPLPQAPAADASAVAAGETLFSMGCADCHGKDGRTPTNIGKSMYPRVPDLGSTEVQRMSNRELFWVIKNGIRLSGMPGFGHILSDDEICQVRDYVRSLGRQPNQ